MLIYLHRGWCVRGLSWMGLSCTGLSLTKVQLHMDSVTWGFSCNRTVLLISICIFSLRETYTFILLLVKLNLLMELVACWFSLRNLLRGDFCLWNLLHVDFSLRETRILVFLLVKPILFMWLVVCWFFVPGTCCVLNFVLFLELVADSFFLFVKVVHWFFHLFFTDFVHATCNVPMFVRGRFCMLFFVRGTCCELIFFFVKLATYWFFLCVKLVHWFLTSWNWFYSWVENQYHWNAYAFSWAKGWKSLSSQ